MSWFGTGSPNQLTARPPSGRATPRREWPGAEERAEGASACILADEEHARISLGHQRMFTFDHVFGPQSTQGDLYATCVEPLVQACFAGYNATVLAYGQTGSGKTFTMGTGNNPAQPIEEHGIIPRVIRTVFQGIHEKRAEARFTVRCQFLEVYNEGIRDLLRPGTPSNALQIRERGAGDIFVAGASEEVAMGYEECLRLLDIGSVGRVTGETNMNQQSSRSHAIFTIIMQQHPVRAGSDTSKAEVVTSKLHLVDLAGSERVKKSNATGDRFKETVTINQGLLALGNVISALGDERRKATHVPYRDSKITRILQDSLGGNSRTLMVATVSTADSCIEESLNTLKYANRARNIRNKPIVNVGVETSPRVMQEEIESMQLELLRQQLEHPSEGGGLLAGLSEDEREQLIQALGGGGQATSELQQRVTTLEEELDAARGCVRQAQTASAAASRSLRDLSEQNTGLQMQLDWQQEKLDAMIALAHELERAGQVPAAARDRLVEIATMVPSAPEGPAESDGEPGRPGKPHRPQSVALGRLQSASRARWQAKQPVGGGAASSVPAELERKLEELKRMAEAAREGAAVAEQRAEAAEAEAAAAREALKQAQDDLVRDEVIFAEKLAEMRGLEADKDAIMLEASQTEERLAAAMAEIAALRERPSGIPLPPSTSGPPPRAPSGQLEDEVSSLRSSAAASTAQPLEEGDDVVIGDNDEAGEEVEAEVVIAAAEEAEGAVAAKAEEVEAAQRAMEASKTGLEAQLRELEHNIDSKEALIARLTENEEQQRRLAAQYEERLAVLQAEVNEREAKVEELRRALEALDSDRAKSEEERQRLREKYEQKLARVEEQLATVRAQLKEADAAKVEKERARARSRVESLEREVESMRNAQTEMKRKVKEAGREAEVRLMALRKEQAALRKELESSQRRVRTLEADNERQRGAIRKRADDAARVGKEGKLRSAPVESFKALLSRATTPQQPVSKAQGAADLARVKAELDAKMRAVGAKREAEDKLKGLQKKRVLLLAQRDAQAKQRNQLELRRIRASQAVGKHIQEMGMAIEELQSELEPLRGKAEADGRGSRAAGEVSALSEQLTAAVERRAALQARLEAQDFLPPEDEALIRELDDAMDALDAELEYVTEESSKAAAAVADGADAAESFQKRTQELGLAEARGLLAQYMETLVGGRDRERANTAKVAEAEVAAAEAAREAREANYRLRLKEMEFDRRLTEAQRDHADKVAALLKQAGLVGESNGAEPNSLVAALDQSGGASASSLDTSELQRLVRFYKEQMESLNKDNFYYRKLNKELKRKMRDEIGASRASSVTTSQQSTRDGSNLRQSRPTTAQKSQPSAASGVSRPETSAEAVSNAVDPANSASEHASTSGSLEQLPSGGAEGAIATSRARMMAELSNYKNRMKRPGSASPAGGSPVTTPSASLRSRALAASMGGATGASQVFGQRQQLDVGDLSGSRAANSTGEQFPRQE